MVYKEFILNTGAKIPAIAFGTYKLTGSDCFEKTKFALQAGYRHVDTALLYENEEEVGRAIRESGIPREDIFLLDKIFMADFRDPEAALDKQLAKLGLDYVDCFIMHWPYPLTPGGPGKSSLDEDWSMLKTWKAMEKLPKSKARSIGVSNFTVLQLKQLLAVAEVVPAVNQCEFHPKLPQLDLVDFCWEHGIVPEAYRPLAGGKLDDPAFVQVAKKHGTDAGAISLSWLNQRKIVVLPKSATPSRIESNLKLIDLDDDDMATIDTLGTANERQCGAKVWYSFDYFNGDYPKQPDV